MLLEKLLSLMVLHLLMFIIPGPNTILVIRNTIRYGLKAGVLSSLGITLAISAHAAFAIIAINKLIELFHEYFFYIKMLGGIYICYIGVNLIWAPLQEAFIKFLPFKLKLSQVSYSKLDISNNRLASSELSEAALTEEKEVIIKFSKHIRKFAAFRMGFFLDLFNPFIVVFYMSISPSYLFNTNIFYSIPLFGGLVAVLNFIWFAGLAYLTSISQNYNRFKVNTNLFELLTGIFLLIYGFFYF